MTYILYIGYQNKNLYTERYITGSSAYSSISFYNYDYNFVHNQRGIIIILWINSIHVIESIKYEYWKLNSKSPLQISNPYCKKNYLSKHLTFLHFTLIIPMKSIFGFLLVDLCFNSPDYFTYRKEIVVTVFNRTKTVMSFSKNIIFCGFIAPQTLNY